jgi:hypothetical protein
MLMIYKKYEHFVKFLFFDAQALFYIHNFMNKRRLQVTKLRIIGEQ